jgi:hypothetical protein
MYKKLSYVANTALVMFFAVVILIPVLGSAGSLEPTAAPAPTMKTLDQVPPTWSMKISGADRFVVLSDFNDEAVLDKETGLVWEKSPSTAKNVWTNAYRNCLNKVVGNRIGWRLPTVEELASLVDPTPVYVPGQIVIPSGHPFTNVQFWWYWTATKQYVQSSIPPTYYSLYSVYLGGWGTDSGGEFIGGVSYFTENTLNNIWCVRGGQGFNEK